MDADQITTDELGGRPFVIRSINTYSYVMIPVMSRHFDMTDVQIQRLLRAMHYQVTQELAKYGVSYDSLGPALVPRPNRHEMAFVFDSTQVASGFYGHEIAEAWIPALQQVGPSKTAISEGDILRFPPLVVWKLLEQQLVGPPDFPRLSTEQYYVIYLTNVSHAQVIALDKAIRARTPAYIGYVDCSAWTPLKLGFGLPQVGLRVENKIITETDDIGNANLRGYPFEEHGFEIVGIDEQLHGVLLDYRIDQGVPGWTNEDSAYSLGALSGVFRELHEMDLEIDETRFNYLVSEEPRSRHGRSIKKAGLLGLDRHELAKAIKDELDKSLVYNIRSIEGTRTVDGIRVAAPENNALMFTVQVQFPDQQGTPQRYAVGIKYDSTNHRGEVATMFG